MSSRECVSMLLFFEAGNAIGITSISSQRFMGQSIDRSLYGFLWVNAPIRNVACFSMASIDAMAMPNESYQSHSVGLLLRMPPACRWCGATPPDWDSVRAARAWSPGRVQCCPPARRKRLKWVSWPINQGQIHNERGFNYLVINRVFCCHSWHKSNTSTLNDIKFPSTFVKPLTPANSISGGAFR